MMRGRHGHGGRGEIGAEGIEAAMRNVEDLEHAEDEGEPQRHNE